MPLTHDLKEGWGAEFISILKIPLSPPLKKGDSKEYR
jgi:hypothetical protein